MDLFDKMATFVRVVEAGSLSAAGKQLRISPAAVSRQIAALEADLRATLLMRTTRRMAITPAGSRYYERCLRILRDVEEAQAVGRGDAFRGLVTVNAPITFGLACVVPHVHALMAKHPGLRVDLHLEDRLVDLLLEGVDVAIRVGSAPPESTEIVAHRLFSFRRVIVASADYLKRKGEPRTPEALAKHDALTRIAGSETESWTLRSDGREARVWLNVAFRSNALQAVRTLAASGAGVALLPDWFVADEVRSGALRVILPSWEAPEVTVNALHRSDQRGSPRVVALIEHLRATCAPPAPRRVRRAAKRSSAELTHDGAARGRRRQALAPVTPPRGH
jgi:DNA-binding transcriptional LysR family regulator